MVIDPFDPWYLYDFWALRGKYGEEEKRLAQMRERIRMEERQKFDKTATFLLGTLTILALAIGCFAAYMGIFKRLFP